jgi:PTH1 family peptidyl-tRNA hydrolase
MEDIISEMNPHFKLLVGLGNPEEKYRLTYHNTGRLFLEYILHHSSLAEGVGEDNLVFSPHGECETLALGGITFARSLLPMNQSGGATLSALRYVGCTPKELLLVHDDADIALGRYKCSFGRGAAGHLGVSSVIRALGTKEFMRLRIGIRDRPGKAGDMVLAVISEAHLQRLHSAFSALTEKLTAKDTFC